MVCVHRNHVISLILLVLLGALPLACWSSSTLFITLTDTPIPTVAPTAQQIDSRYKAGDLVTVPSEGVFGAVYLNSQPGATDAPQSRRRWRLQPRHNDPNLRRPAGRRCHLLSGRVQ